MLTGLGLTAVPEHPSVRILLPSLWLFPVEGIYLEPGVPGQGSRTDSFHLFPLFLSFPPLPTSPDHSDLTPTNAQWASGERTHQPTPSGTLSLFLKTAILHDSRVTFISTAPWGCILGLSPAFLPHAFYSPGLEKEGEEREFHCCLGKPRTSAPFVSYWALELRHWLGRKEKNTDSGFKSPI